MKRFDRMGGVILGAIVGGIWAGALGLAIGFEYGGAPPTESEPTRTVVEVRISVTDREAVDHAVEPVKTETYEVTAYTAGPESTGKTPDHPAYGITASGAKVREGHTVACPPAIPFGTRLLIEGVGVRTCEDRGSAITDGKLDVYMADLDEALAFGRRMLDVKILSNESEDETNE